jgi:hypothetical protein
VRHLGAEDQDGQCVDEAHHHAARDEPHQAGHPRPGEQDLEDTPEDDGRDEVVQSVVAYQRRHHQSDRAGRGADHRRPSSGEGDDHGHREGGEQPDPRVDAGEDGEADRLGDQGQCDDESGEDLGAGDLRREPCGTGQAQGR